MSSVWCTVAALLVIVGLIVGLILCIYYLPGYLLNKSLSSIGTGLNDFFSQLGSI